MFPICISGAKRKESDREVKVLGTGRGRMFGTGARKKSGAKAVLSFGFYAS